MAAFGTTMPAKHSEHMVMQRARTSSHHSHHQLRRSITEQSPPFRQSRVHQYIHRKDRDRGDQLPLSAGPLGRDSLELSRAEAATSTGTRMVLNTGDDVPDTSETRTSQHVLANDLITQEKQKAAAVASLKRSLVELNSFSNATIARLDDTYSSILQRLGSLKSTVVAMRELAAMSQDLKESFTGESRALVSEIESQLCVDDQSEDQKKRIQDLQARIHAGRGKVQALSKRVDVVRERIEGWEKADKEWQERTRKRLRIIWIFISAVAFVLVVLFIGAQYAPSATDVGKLAKMAPGASEEMESSVRNNTLMVDEVREELTLRRATALVDQEALRIFDEL
ncbi:hypothetical protein F5B22DRAFT_607631 [Xylaria bambusicola]|uniref:uncharacterized protein n=1 Tax=Xylaria bambusicola TaxID=326684 RepID=UPI002007864A|nr:uncharacterized protein F5B22DRAFT_607631 [Xylaria bambusicola]KAI0515229.1 hypothetical protein F5B22DRAFT_607631 [Xylaria bambusicola]